MQLSEMHGTRGFNPFHAIGLFQKTSTNMGLKPEAKKYLPTSHLISFMGIYCLTILHHFEHVHASLTTPCQNDGVSL